MEFAGCWFNSRFWKEAHLETPPPGHASSPNSFSLQSSQNKFDGTAVSISDSQYEIALPKGRYDC